MRAHPDEAAQWAEVARVIERFEYENERSCHERFRRIDLGMESLVQMSEAL